MHGSKCNGVEHSKVRLSAISFPREIACKIDHYLSQTLFIYLLSLFLYDLGKLYYERFSYYSCYRSPSPDSGGKLFSAVDGIEDTLYYFSDVISAGIPDIGRLITDHILQHLTLPLLLPSLCSEAVNVQNITFFLLILFSGVIYLFLWDFFYPCGLVRFDYLLEYHF